MSEQPLDLKRSLHIVRRRWQTVAAASALGLALGSAYAVVRPPAVTSTALVRIASPQSAFASNGAPTLVVIATSDPVLSLALPAVRPPVSESKLQKELEVKSLTPGIISIRAQAPTASDAETTANAVARAFVQYITSPQSLSGSTGALLLQPASTAVGRALPVAIAILAIIGLLIAAVLAAIGVLAAERRDRRLRHRDEIADSIGVPVLASVPVGHPTDAAGWVKLLTEYEPTAVDAWRLRGVLDYLGVIGPAADGASQAERASLAVVSLRSDPGALALGPQLAVFAAGLGIAHAPDPRAAAGPGGHGHAAHRLRGTARAPAPAGHGPGRGQRAGRPVRRTDRPDHGGGREGAAVHRPDAHLGGGAGGVGRRVHRRGPGPGRGQRHGPRPPDHRHPRRRPRHHRPHHWPHPATGPDDRPAGARAPDGDTDGDTTVDDPDQTAIIGRIPRLDPAPPAWDDPPPEAEAAGGTGLAGDSAAGLASLSFIVAAARRRRRTALIFAVIGLFLGAGLFVAKPPPYRASTEVFLTLGPNENANTAIDTDEALATSRPVAAAALKQLGPVTSVNSLLASIVAVPVTDRVLLITVTEHSSAEAVSVASAVTSAFLRYRNSQLESYQQLVTNSLNQQISKGQAKVTTLTRQIAALTGHTKTATAAAQLSTLKGELTQAATAQTTLVAGARSTQQTTDSGTSVAVSGSSVINAAALIPKSRPKQAIIYAVTGLFAGGALSIGIVVIFALISDRLRWRDDIAHALGTSVRLSVGPVRLRRWLPLPGHRGLAAVSDPRIQRVASHLRGRVSASPGSGLALIPSDRDDVAAVAIVALALSCAEQGSRVILADLCPGAPAARLLAAADPGLHQVETAGTRLMVMVPEASEFAPSGPLKPAGAGTPAREVSPELPPPTPRPTP